MTYNPLKDEIFLPIPLKIAKRNDISERAKLIYGYLLKTLGKFKECRITMAKIGNELNIPRQKVSKHISELKIKRLITINKTGKASIYDFLPIDDVTHAVTTDVTPAVTADVTHAVTPLINKEVLIESLKESEAAPDFFKKLELWRSIPIEIRRRLRKKQVVKGSFEKIEYAVERMNHAIKTGGSPARAFQDAFKGDHAKLARKMEDNAVKEQDERKRDTEIMIDYVAEYRKSDFGQAYKDKSDAEIETLKSFKNFSDHINSNARSITP